MGALDPRLRGDDLCRASLTRFTRLDQNKNRKRLIFIDLILFIPFPRVRGKVGWGRPDQGVLTLILSILVFCLR